MSDHYTTQYNHKKRVLEDIRSLRHFTFACHYTFEKYLQAKHERIHESNSYKRLTRYNQSYVQAYLDQLFNDIQKATELRYKVNGVYDTYKNHMSTVEPNSDDSFDLNMLIADRKLSQPASFWVGTDKIFNPYKSEDWNR